MAQQIPVEDAAKLHGPENEGVTEIAPNVAYQRLGLANVVYSRDANSDRWVLVDAGLHGTGRAIIRAAEAQFGKLTRPDAIILTHGHFDHVGALEELNEKWNVPIYAHLWSTRT